MKVTSLKDQNESIQGDQLKDIAEIPLKQEKNEITSFGNTVGKQVTPSNNTKSLSNNNNNNNNTNNNNNSAKPDDDKQITLTRLLPNDDKQQTITRLLPSDEKQQTITRLPPNDDKTRNSQEAKAFENKLPSSQAPDIVSLAGSDSHQILKKDIMAESGANNNGKINETKEAASSLNNEKKVIVDIEENSPEMTSNKKKPQKKNIKEEVKENPVNEKHRRIVSWIVAVLVFVLTLGIAIYCTVTYAKRKHLPTEYDYVIENWKNAPIITIRPSNVGCAEYLTEYDFPGTIDGCDCRASLSVIFGNKIYPSSCSDEQKSTGCTGVNSTPTVTFTSWMINSQIFRLCVDRLQGFSYTDSDCKQTGFRICGVGSAAGASKTNMFCLPTTSSCPINGISYGVTAPDSTFASIFNTGVGNIFVSREQVNSQPLAFTRISTGSGECKDFKEYHFFDSFVTPYQLLRNKDKTCEFADTDFRFNNLFSLTETNLFTANSYSSVISALPAYPLAQNQNYFLTTRNYIPWQQEGDCRYTHMQRFVDLDSSIRFINYLWVGAVVVSWLVFVAFGVVVNVLRLKCDYYLTKWQVLMVWLLILLLLGFMAAGFVFSLFLNWRITSIKDAKCSDLSTNSMLARYRDDFFMTYFIPWIVLLAAIILLILICLIFIKIIFFRPKEKVVQDEEKDHLGDDDLLLGENDNNNNEKDRGNNPNRRKKNSVGNDGSNGNGGYSNTFNIDGNNIINDSTKGVTYNNPSSAQNTPRKNNQKNGNNDGFNNENTNNNNNNMSGNNPNQGAQGNNKYRSSKTYNSTYKLKDGENTSAPKLKNITLSSKTRNYEMEVVTEAGNPTQATKSRRSIDAARDKFLLNRYGGGTRNGEDISEANKMSSLVQMEEMEDLEDHNDWEFEIDGYVKQHREARATASNRIGGGYDIAKNKEKYLGYKYQHKNRRSQLNQNNEPDIFGYTENNNNTTNLVLHDPSATENAENADKTESLEGVLPDDSTQKKSIQDNAENSNTNQPAGGDAADVAGGDTNNNNTTPNPNEQQQ